MKKIRLNTRFLVTEAVPLLLAVEVMLWYFCGWMREGAETTLCAVVFLLCTWSAVYGEWKLVRGKISKLRFGIFCASFLFMLAVMTKLFAMTEVCTPLKSFYGAPETCCTQSGD